MSRSSTFVVEPTLAASTELANKNVSLKLGSPNNGDHPCIHPFSELCGARALSWSVLVALCMRLEAMRECLVENQQRRAIYERRKEAAVRIASWYKDILTARRHRYLIESCRWFKNFSIAAMDRAKARVRRKCARRILDFMVQDINTSRITAAVQKLRRTAVSIQRCWRTRVASREAQTALLLRQLAQFELRLLAYNRRKATGNNANVFAATARKTVALHEEMKNTLLQSTAELRLRGTGFGATKRTRRVKMDDDEEGMTPEQMLFLNTLTVRLPASIKDQVDTPLPLSSRSAEMQVVAERLSEEIRRFYHKWDIYTAEKKVYETQKPIDEARIKLLASAGISAEVQVHEPIRPRLRVLQTPGQLASMLEKGLRGLVNNQQNTNADARPIRHSILG